MAAADVKAGRLLVVGELCADIVVELDAPPAFGQAEQVVPRTTITMGSSSAITACGAAAMDTATSLVGVVGADLLGDFLLGELRERGVDVSHCRVDGSRPTGISTILTLPVGDRCILTAMGSIGAVEVTDVPAAVLEDAAHLHVGSYFLQHGLQPDLARFFASCRQRGIATSLDPNFDPRGDWSSGIEQVLGEVDVFFCNEQEALGISRAEELDCAASWLAERLPDGAELVVKHGAEGARVHVCGRGQVQTTYSVQPEPLRWPLVDTVGAGDSLAAGYLAARLRGLDIEDRLRIGVRGGTASTRAAGGVAAQLTWLEAQNPTMMKAAPVSQWQRTHP